MSRYLKPRDHGYLMEAAACIKVLEDLRHIEAKYARTVEKEGAVRQAERKELILSCFPCGNGITSPRRQEEPRGHCRYRRPCRLCGA